MSDFHTTVVADYRDGYDHRAHFFGRREPAEIAAWYAVTGGAPYRVGIVGAESTVWYYAPDWTETSETFHRGCRSSRQPSGSRAWDDFGAET
jgi:hypothetical protein